MASALAKGLMWGTLVGATYGAGVTWAQGYMETEPIPGSPDRIEACAATLGDIATDTVVLDPACEDFSFKYTITKVMDPLGEDSSEIIYHLPPNSEFPAYAQETKRAEDEYRNRFTNVFTVIFGGIGFLVAGGAAYSRAKRKERWQEQAIE